MQEHFSLRAATEIQFRKDRNGRRRDTHFVAIKFEMMERVC